jgi:hypothetical protein
MLSRSARIGAPAVGFAAALVVTYGLADATPGPAPARILQDVLASRISTGSGMRSVSLGNTDPKFAERRASFRDQNDERLASFDERFAGAVIRGPGMRLASLEMPVYSNSVLSDAGSLGFAALKTSLGARFQNERSDSFDERFSGARASAKAVDMQERDPSWVVQLIGDDSEAVALSRFRELQNKHKSLLGMYKPVVLRTALTPGSEPIWTRVRVELSSRQAADALCSKLEAAGERCVVQRNANIARS